MTHHAGTSHSPRYTDQLFASDGLLTIGIEVKKVIKQVKGLRVRLERQQ